jgi:hypothetical protein
MNLKNEFGPLVLEMLTEFGTKATLTRKGASLAPTTDQKFNKAARVAKQATTQTTLAVVAPQQIKNDEGRYVSASVATLLAKPIEGDTLTMGTQVWTIGEVTSVAPQGEAIVYMAVVS